MHQLSFKFYNHSNGNIKLCVLFVKEKVHHIHIYPYIYIYNTRTELMHVRAPIKQEKAESCGGFIEVKMRTTDLHQMFL